MTFSVSLDEGGLEWAGTSLNTVFAQRRNLLSPTSIGMLRDIMRFNGSAQRNLELAIQTRASMGELLTEGGYGGAFQREYLLPMAAAIWSSATADILAFPATTFLRFCLNHALLQVNRRPQWKTVVGGGGSTYSALQARSTTSASERHPRRAARRGRCRRVHGQRHGTLRRAGARHSRTDHTAAAGRRRSGRARRARGGALSTERRGAAYGHEPVAASSARVVGVELPGQPAVSTACIRCASVIWSISCSRCRSRRRSSSRSTQ